MKLKLFVVTEVSPFGNDLTGVFSSKEEAKRLIPTLKDVNGKEIQEYGEVEWDVKDDNYGGVRALYVCFHIQEVELDVPNHSDKKTTEVGAKATY